MLRQHLGVVAVQTGDEGVDRYVVVSSSVEGCLVTRAVIRRVFVCRLQGRSRTWAFRKSRATASGITMRNMSLAVRIDQWFRSFVLHEHKRSQVRNLLRTLFFQSYLGLTFSRKTMT